MKISLLLTLVMLGMAVSMPAVTTPSLSIDATLEDSSSEGLQIQFVVHNLSKTPMRMYASLLPWSRSATTIVILRTIHGALLESQSGRGELPPAGKITLKADDSVSGAIKLKELFPVVPKNVEREGGLLFWSYSFEADGRLQESREYYGGVLIMPSHQSTVNIRPVTP